MAFQGNVGGRVCRGRLVGDWCGGKGGKWASVLSDAGGQTSLIYCICQINSFI